MISTYEEFEAALDRLSQRLDHLSAPGGPDADEVARLLKDIDDYRPSIPAAQEDSSRFSGLRSRADTLATRATEFARQRSEREHNERLMDFPEDGQGIGPTTGV